MGQLKIQHPFSLPPPPLPPLPPPSSSRKDAAPPSSSSGDEPPPPTPPPFDPSRTIGIIRRKSLTRDLAGAFHAECLTYCQEISELQDKLDEPFIDIKAPENSRKETTRPPKRLKKSR